MKITYTRTGEAELTAFKSKQQEELESFIRQDKYVYGDEEIEVTASDVKKASRVMKAGEEKIYLSLVTSSAILSMVSVVVLMVGAVFRETASIIFWGIPIFLNLMSAGAAVMYFKFRSIIRDADLGLPPPPSLQTIDADLEAEANARYKEMEMDRQVQQIARQLELIQKQYEVLEERTKLERKSH